MVTVPVVVAPPRTDVGLKVTEPTVGAVTVKVAVEFVVLAAAVIVDVVVVLPSVVETVKVAEVEPTGIVTDAGTVAALVLLEVSVTTVATGAAAERVTVADDVAPPRTEVGVRTTLATLGLAVIVKAAVADWPFAVAVIVEDPAVNVNALVTVNVAVVEPDATVTVAGTDAPVVLERLTTKPAAGAAELIVTVPVEVAPPSTLVGLKVRPVTAGGVTVSVAVLLEPE